MNKHTHKPKFIFTIPYIGGAKGLVYQCVACKDVVMLSTDGHTGKVIVPEGWEKL